MQSAKNLKNVGVLDAAKLVNLAIEKADSLDELRGLAKQIRLAIFSHADYKKPEQKSHIVARREDVQTIMNKLMGKNAAYKAAIAELKAGNISPEKWIDPKKHHYSSLNQILFASKSYNNMFLFAGKKIPDLITPNEVTNYWKKAGELSPSKFAETLRGKNKAVK